MMYVYHEGQTERGEDQNPVNSTTVCVCVCVCLQLTTSISDDMNSIMKSNFAIKPHEQRSGMLGISCTPERKYNTPRVRKNV